MSGALRVLFIQYANPAAYPPLQHATRILVREGWRVMVLGVESPGMEAIEWPRTEGVDFRVMRGTPGGLLLKLQYLLYSAWVIVSAILWKPAVLYASDPLAAPVALFVRRIVRCHLVYHEHDSPGTPRGSSARTVAGYRNRVVRAAQLCVLPNTQRAAAFIAETGADPEKVLCAWNCPMLDEAREPPSGTRNECTVYFHGSLNETRLPFSVLDAIARLPAGVRLEFAGYETLGSRGYVERFLAHAARIGLARERVSYLGPASRERVLDWASRCDVGLAFMPLASDDINMRHMVGASNKPFDYLAVGLALLVSRLPEWEQTFVAPGYACACDPADPASIAAALAPLAADPARRRAMGMAGLARIRADWNYERQFAPVAARLLALAERGA